RDHSSAHGRAIRDTIQAARLRELTRVGAGPLASLAAQHANYLATRDAAGLTTPAAALEQAGLLLIAADAMAQAAGLHRRDRASDAAAATAARALALA